MSTSAAPGDDIGDIFLGDQPNGGPANGDKIVIPADPPPPAPPAPTDEERKFTAKDIERIRKEEKDKLYPQFEAVKEELAAIRKQREEEEAAKKQTKAQQEAAAKAMAEEEMSARELLEARELEWDERMRKMEEELAARDALLEREREFNALQDYKAECVKANADNILPELRDLVTGNTYEEVEASVASLVERSARILEQVGQAQQQARQQMRTVSSAAPSVGPMDNEPGQQTFSAADIAAMDMQTYAKHRAKLLQAGSAARTRQVSGEGRGLFN